MHAFSLLLTSWLGSLLLACVFITGLSWGAHTIATAGAPFDLLEQLYAFLPLIAMALAAAGIRFWLDSDHRHYEPMACFTGILLAGVTLSGLLWYDQQLSESMLLGILPFSFDMLPAYLLYCIPPVAMAGALWLYPLLQWLI